MLHTKGSTNLSRTEYEYDLNGNRKKETINRTGGGQVTTYGYDEADRLKTTLITEPGKTIATVYEYDAVANRKLETVTTVDQGASTTASKTYTYDGRNQLRKIVDTQAGTIELDYDGEGNLVSKALGTDETRYGYNANNALTGVKRNGTVLGSYFNDYRGLRVEKDAKDPLFPNAPAVRTRTLWDGRNAFQDSAVGGAVLTRYEHDGRNPVSMWSRDDGIQALHRDALGSVVATTDSTGQLKSENVFDAFGKLRVSTGASANKFGYTGHQMDRETGLIYFQARYYDPELGRFITQDPYEGDWKTPLSLHHYLYAYGNPTVYVDLDGYYARDAGEARALIAAEDKCANGDCKSLDAQRNEFSKRSDALRHCASVDACRAQVGAASAGLAKMQDRIYELEKRATTHGWGDPGTGNDGLREHGKLIQQVSASRSALLYGTSNLRQQARAAGIELTTHEQSTAILATAISGNILKGGFVRGRITTGGKAPEPIVEVASNRPVPVLIVEKPTASGGGAVNAPGVKANGAAKPRKTSEQMTADAKAIHGQLETKRARNGATVATGDFDGDLVYSVSSNKTTKAMREKAEELGYERIAGKKYTAANQTDAEQIMLNWAEGAGKTGQGKSGRIAPSRPACGGARQDCAGRIDRTPGVELIGTRKGR